MTDDKTNKTTFEAPHSDPKPVPAKKDEGWVLFLMALATFVLIFASGIAIVALFVFAVRCAWSAGA